MKGVTRNRLTAVVIMGDDIAVAGWSLLILGLSAGWVASVDAKA